MVEERDEFIDSKFSIHDSHRFEIKLDIPLKDKGESIFKIEYFFFIPKSLNIYPQNYTKEIFYSDTQHYIRFKTPNISLEKLFYPQNELSPYNRAMKNIDILNSGKADDFIIETIIDELKLLGCIIKVELRDVIDFFTKSIKEKTNFSEDKTALIDSIRKFKSDIEIAIKSIDLLKTAIFTSNINQKIKETFLILDEYINLIISEYILVLVNETKDVKNIDLQEIVLEFKNVIIERQKYMLSMGYKSAFINGEVDDHFMYYRSLMKKFISSALYLKPEVSEFNIFSHFGPAIAAGIAMLFAIIVTIYAQSRYAINSINFIFIIVISYIFKDRIKDWLKIIFSKRFGNWLYDRKINVTEPAHNIKFGYIKETFSFIPFKMLPSDILRIKNVDGKNIDEDIKYDIAFKYKKEINLNRSNIAKHHQRRKDLIDIMRFSILDFIKHIDDAYVDYKIIDEKGEIKNLKCMRLYHINFIIKYHIKEDEVKYERVRILLNKDGIVRLEEVNVE